MLLLFCLPCTPRESSVVASTASGAEMDMFSQQSAVSSDPQQVMHRNSTSCAGPQKPCVLSSAQEFLQREARSLFTLFQAVRREFWNSRKRFDAELGRIAEKVEQAHRSPSEPPTLHPEIPQPQTLNLLCEHVGCCQT